MEHIPNIKLIALDLDGTLLNSCHEISPQTLECLKQVIAQGIQVVITTGKTHFSAVNVKKQLDLKTWGVFTQGLTILDPNGKTVYYRTLPDAVSTAVVNYLTEHNLDFVAYKDSGLYTLNPSEFDRFLTDRHEPHPVPTGNATNFLDESPFQKFLIYGEHNRLEKLLAELKNKLNIEADFVFSLDEVLEIIPAGSSKGDGVARMLKELSISPAEIVAFGDGDNDLEMLTMAGIGVAMANGTEKTRSAADFVTLSNDQDGIPHALAHLGILES